MYFFMFLCVLFVLLLFYFIFFSFFIWLFVVVVIWYLICTDKTNDFINNYVLFRLIDAGCNPFRGFVSRFNFLSMEFWISIRNMKFNSYITRLYDFCVFLSRFRSNVCVLRKILICQIWSDFRLVLSLYLIFFLVQKIKRKKVPYSIAMERFAD